MQEGDGVWPRAGVLRHVSYSTPLVIPYQSAGARERTPRPKPNRACTPPLSPLLGSFSRLLGRELGTRVSRVGNTSLTFHTSSCSRVTGSSIELHARFSISMATAAPAPAADYRASSLSAPVTWAPPKVPQRLPMIEQRQSTPKMMKPAPRSFCIKCI